MIYPKHVSPINCLTLLIKLIKSCTYSAGHGVSQRSFSCGLDVELQNRFPTILISSFRKHFILLFLNPSKYSTYIHFFNTHSKRYPTSNPIMCEIKIETDKSILYGQIIL